MDTQQYLRNIKKRISILDSYVEGEERLLLCLALKKTSAQLFLQKEISDSQIEMAEKVVNRRLNNEPLDKIFHNAEFMGYEFYVNRDVLSPRKESELLVEKALTYASVLLEKKEKINVLDMCCGSGCLGISIKKLLQSKVDVTLCDVSEKALKVAQKNANGLEINIVKSNMFQDLKSDKKFDIILCNPPYISQKEYEKLSLSVKNYDPKIALVGGADGLKFYRILANEGKKYLTKQGQIVMEIGYNEKDSTQKIFQDKSFFTTVFKDYSGLNRVVVAKLEKKDD